eukprot:c22051_g1_i1 orf=111-995(+)
MLLPPAAAPPLSLPPYPFCHPPCASRSLCSSSPVYLRYCVCRQVCCSHNADKKEKVPIFMRRTTLQCFLLSATTEIATGYGVGVLADELSAVSSCKDLTVTKKVFFDISIDGQPAGRVVVGIYGEDVPLGAKRFYEIAVGNKGVSYRKKEFYKITSSFIQNAGLRSFSLSGGMADAAKFTGGETADLLIPEMEQLDKRCRGMKNVKGTVSLVVKDPTIPPPKRKLIAKDGKFEMLQQISKPNPNGTEFTITTADAPELDGNNLVVGRVVNGIDVVQRIAGVKAVQENSSSLYFK